MSTPTTLPTVHPAELTGYHECDADHVERAREGWRNDAGLTITLCGHHSREHGVGLMLKGFRLVMVTRGDL